MKSLMILATILGFASKSQSADFTIEISVPLPSCSPTQYLSTASGNLVCVDKNENAHLIGTIITHAGRSCPDKTLPANGAELSKQTYPELYESYKRGDSQALYGENSTTFKLPNLMGKFLRGAQEGALGADPEQASRIVSDLLGANIFKVGSNQGDKFKSHTHIQDAHRHNYSSVDINITANASSGYGTLSRGGTTPTNSGMVGNRYTINDDLGAIWDTVATNQNTGGIETRPANQSVLYCVYAGR